MFAVFAENFHGEEFFGHGLNPQMAWENMLGDFVVDEEDIDLETVRFFVETEVFRETKVSWTVPEDTDSDD
jgi:hypothetical protein